MDSNKKPLADKLFRDVQIAHLRGVIQMNHANSLQQTLSNYDNGLADYASSPIGADRQERALRYRQAEILSVRIILAECYDVDKQKMLENLKASPSLLNKMPLITEFLEK